MAKPTSSKFSLWQLFALVAVCLLPALIMRDPSPPNELRYLSIADEALRDGTFFTFHNQGLIYTDKPPLFFWIIMLFRVILGCHCMPVLCIVASLIPAFVIVAVMDKWLMMGARKEMYSGWNRAAAAFMLLTGILFLGQAIFLRMDILMSMFITLALFSFYKMYTGKGNRKKESVLMPVYIFLGLFTKGPVGIFAPLLIILVFLIAERRWKDIGKYLGLKTWAILLALFAMWIGCAYLEGGREYINSLLFHQTLDRAVNAFHHKEPFWYYLGTIWYVIIPYSLMMIPAIVFLFIKRQGYTIYRRLMLTAITVTFVMLSCFSGKLAIYLTPMFAFMAYLMPQFDIGTGERGHRWAKVGLWIPAVILALGGVAMAALNLVPAVAERFGKVTESAPYLISPPITIAAVLLLVGGILSCVVLARGTWQKGTCAIAVTLLAAMFAGTFAMEQINEWTAYEYICREAAEIDDASGDRNIVNTLFVNRPENMDVYLGHDIIDYKNDVDAFLKEDHSGEVLIVKDRKAAESQPLQEYLEGKKCSRAGEHTAYLL